MRAKDKEFGKNAGILVSFEVLIEVIWLFRGLGLEPWLRDDLGRKGRVAHTWALLWLLVLFPTLPCLEGSTSVLRKRTWVAFVSHQRRLSPDFSCCSSVQGSLKDLDSLTF